MGPVSDKKAPKPTDVHVGQRVRMRRNMLGITQTQLGAELQVTFQQVQKYENGTNRIGASRLQQIASALQVPVSYFFEEDAPATVAEDHELLAEFHRFMSTREALDLAMAFQKIESRELRSCLVEMVERLVETR